MVPFTDNPNCPNCNGWTPIHGAICKGYTEIVRILAPLTDYPNSPDRDGDTPIYNAARNGHTEIVKILAPLIEDPNAPNVKTGRTPMDVAKTEEIRKILASFTSNKRQAGPSELTYMKQAKKFK